MILFIEMNSSNQSGGSEMSPGQFMCLSEVNPVRDIKISYFFLTHFRICRVKGGWGRGAFRIPMKVKLMTNPCQQENKHARHCHWTKDLKFYDFNWLNVILFWIFFSRKQLESSRFLSWIFKVMKFEQHERVKNSKTCHKSYQIDRHQCTANSWK